MLYNFVFNVKTVWQTHFSNPCYYIYNIYGLNNFQYFRPFWDLECPPRTCHNPSIIHFFILNPIRVWLVFALSYKIISGEYSRYFYASNPPLGEHFLHTFKVVNRIENDRLTTVLCSFFDPFLKRSFRFLKKTSVIENDPLVLNFHKRSFRF